jgi:hypothetical protein
MRGEEEILEGFLVAEPGDARRVKELVNRPETTGKIG